MPPQIPRSGDGAWTPAEILIAALAAGILLAVAAPRSAPDRARSERRFCIVNLKVIDSAKRQYALDNGVGDGAAVSMSQLMGAYIQRPGSGSRDADPRCPSSNRTYDSTVGAIGEPPRCPTDSARTGPFPHDYP